MGHVCVPLLDLCYLVHMLYMDLAYLVVTRSTLTHIQYVLYVYDADDYTI